MAKIFPNTHGARKARALKSRLTAKPAPPMPKKPAPKKVEEPVKQQRALSVQWVILYGEVTGRTPQGIQRDLASEMRAWTASVRTPGRDIHGEYRIKVNQRLQGTCLVRLAAEVLGHPVADVRWKALKANLENALKTTLTKMTSGPKRIHFES